MGAAGSEARKTGFGVLLDTKNFFLRNRNIKQAASTLHPLPPGTLVLNCSIHEQRAKMPRWQESDSPFPWFQLCSHQRHGGRERRGLVAGNQTLVELGCWVVGEAVFSSSITGAPYSLLGARLLPIGRFFARAWGVSVSVGEERGRLREGKQNRSELQGSGRIRTHDPNPLLGYRPRSLTI